MTRKPQRIRDPVHNLIEFDNTEFEYHMWRVIQTRPFQRLRRIKQLGFTDLVYPGATHTRFIHSIGTFHIARKLINIIKRRLDINFSATKANIVLAAALLHDVGHGMFSHAFEDVLAITKVDSISHEEKSRRLITDSEIADVLSSLGSGFPDDVANVISKEPEDIYDAIVSSQFDADRLDYMQRDRLMVGIQNSAIDFTWLLSNMEIGIIPLYSEDGERYSELTTLTLNRKAIYAAETYVLSLFQLYPTVYFHKAVRAAESMFTALLTEVFKIIKSEGASGVKRLGLPENHQYVNFVNEPKNIDNILQLDDTVFWNSLYYLAESDILRISKLAKQLLERNLYKAIDIHLLVKQMLRDKGVFDEIMPSISTLVKNYVINEIEQYNSALSKEQPRILIDGKSRKLYEYNKTPNFSQIFIEDVHGEVQDIALESPVVVTRPYKLDLFRAYVDRGDNDGYGIVMDISKRAVEQAIKEAK
ncbi:HD domain-containing protein [Oceanithermus desulfurans]|uniref:HD domain-containing protein n=1 Tax=Oceanithermus desulfurans TaxID=227924 RepID=UPI001609E3F5|nr:HD domain-containing protein [Oceanithermus desulfurans]